MLVALGFLAASLLGLLVASAFWSRAVRLTTARIKQGGAVTAASIITQTQPSYPPLARQARIQGAVVLHAIIDKQGRVAQLEVVSGHPLLVQSAMEAVRQWRYKPTQLNGDPVEVDTTIQVTFTMGA